MEESSQTFAENCFFDVPGAKLGRERSSTVRILTTSRQFSEFRPTVAKIIKIFEYDIDVIFEINMQMFHRIALSRKSNHFVPLCVSSECVMFASDLF